VKTTDLLVLAIALSICLSGPVNADEGKGESGKGRAPTEQYQQDDGRSSYFHRHGYDRLDIPNGHYPPPGECRIWYPDRPAGQQPPPGKCEQLRTQVPLGAWLIHHPEEDPEPVQVIVYDERHPGTIQVVGEFDIGSGLFVRIVPDK
jgi:hypothetical protein